MAVALRCNNGTFVEFGARDGIQHSNTLLLERQLGWRGVLVEADENEYRSLQQNRPGAFCYHGAVCPRGMSEMTLALSSLGGWTGMNASYEPQRRETIQKVTAVPCYQLDQLLRRQGMHRVDYMTIDTEGSELALINDFPWDQFDVRVVQVEQLDEHKFPAQAGREANITARLARYGYRLHTRFVVAQGDTYDLIYVQERPGRLWVR